MIVLYINNSKNTYHHIPKHIRKKYMLWEKELSQMECKATSISSIYTFSSWEDCFRNELSDSNPILSIRRINFFEKEQSIDNKFKYFLDSMVGKLQWASFYIKDSQKIFINACTMSPKHNKTLASFGAQKNYQYLDDAKHFVYSAFLKYLSPRSRTSDFIHSLFSLQNNYTAMNCEQFLLYTLISLNVISPYHAQLALFSTSLEHDFSYLHNFLCLKGAQSRNLGDLSSIQKNGVSIVFECKDPEGTRVSHVSIYCAGHIYELCFGKNEEEFNVMKTELDLYMKSVASRRKYAFILPVSELNVQEQIKPLENYIMERISKEEVADLTFLNKRFNVKLRDKVLCYESSNHEDFMLPNLDIPSKLKF